MYKPGRSGGDVEILGVKEVCEKYEIEKPEQFIDILGMMGDSVDNIPGIPGVGLKTAIKFIKQFGSLEGLYENTDKIKGKMKEKVEANREQAFMSKELATIVIDVPVEFDEKALIIEEPDKEKLLAVFEDLEFRTLGRNILGEAVSVVKSNEDAPQLDLFGSDDESNAPSPASEIKTIEDTDHDYNRVEGDEAIKELVSQFLKSKSFCFDTETTGIDPHQAELVGIAFSKESGKAYYIPIPSDQDKTRHILSLLKPLLEQKEIEKVGQNIKYDIEVLAHHGISVQGPLFDTMIAHFLLHPDMKNNMDDMAEYYLFYKPVSIETLIGPKGNKQGNMRDVPVEDVVDYACEDADITWQLKLAIENEMTEEHVLKLFKEMECPLISVLADMENEGIKLDVPALNAMSESLNEEAISMKEKVFELAGVEFNLDSPKQLGEILFDHLKIDENAKKTKTGQYQTNESTLEKLAQKHEIIPIILDYRSVRKLKSTYVDSLPQMVNPKTGRVHTNYMQTVAATGRLSSNSPNLQNIPIRTDRGREVRKAFIPRNDDYLMLAADYSQVELRIIAAISEDDGMINAFKDGLDIHRATAAKVFGVDLDDVTRDMRSKAKAVNFGIAYGQGAFGLAQNLGISRGEAREIIDSYVKQFPGITKYKESSIEIARKTGYAETIMGRRRYVPDINSKNHVVRSAAERNAINAPIQGSAADVIKVAMINLQKALEEKGFKSKMLLQVHDELVFDAHKSEVEEITPIIRKEMEKAHELIVPLVVDISTGNNWLEAH
jgi:DNA polymerase-1